MSRPRILYILSSLAANDLGDEIITILGRLSRSEFEPRVIALGGKEELMGRLVEMKVRCYPLGLAGALGTYRAVAKTKALLRKLDPAVVHGYGSWGGSVAQLASPPNVHVVRTVTQPPNHESDLRGRVLQYLERRGRTKPGTRFIVPNEESRGLATRAYGAQEQHVVVLPRSVDVGDVRDRVARTGRDEARTLMGVGGDDLAVVLLSGFESGARMDQILTGFAMALEEEPRLRLFVVGSGRYEGSTRWKAEELRLGDSVVFLGRGTETGPIWSAADAAIDASPWASWS
ncbi:MAG: glycosyltransferase, partial [Gemmatimonadota bacterium]